MLIFSSMSMQGLLGLAYSRGRLAADVLHKSVESMVYGHKASLEPCLSGAWLCTAAAAALAA